MAEPSVDTLTAVYDGVDPRHLREALASLAAQTVSPRRCLVVADGVLTEPLEAVLRELAEELPLEMIRLERRSGSGPAKQCGLEASDAELVAIADADDISRPDRLARQLEIHAATGADVVGSATEEFDDVSGQVWGVRAFPLEHDEIVALMRRVNPINHPTVLMSRAAALSVGGYCDLPFLEDYDLWARMAAAGAVLANSPEPLVRFRGGSAALRRRRTRGIARSELRLQHNLVSYGTIGRGRAMCNMAVRSAFRSLPSPLMRYSYRRRFLTRS